eukprot:TRINITY_DN76172_c0_g1_i1.p1 TRINITY_DN76172_c0_g1~~TRINITY_DN76172_c0_g1_i1.p1  ORF type:complete len:130 (+),score=14.09 TRINITY_DN76172_c0_g1_i1:152-541(+)
MARPVHASRSSAQAHRRRRAATTNGNLSPREVRRQTQTPSRSAAGGVRVEDMNVLYSELSRRLASAASSRRSRFTGRGRLADTGSKAHTKPVDLLQGLVHPDDWMPEPDCDDCGCRTPPCPDLEEPGFD